MINRFKLQLFIPSLNRKEYFDELRNLHLINILKFITNKDTKGLSQYFDFLLLELLHNKEIFYKLDVFDKSIILLQLKAININSEIKFKLKIENENKLILFNLFNEIKSLTEKPFVKSKEIEIDKNFKLYLSLPTTLYIENIDDIFNHCIKTIIIDNVTYDFEKLDLSIKEKLFENISGIHTQKIIMFFEEIKESCKGLYFLSQNKYLNELNSLELNPFNNSIISFLELMYSEDLKNIFDLMYILASKIKISIEEFLNLIPSESLMLYSLYAKEVQQQNDDIEKSTKKNDIPLKTQPLV